uniref:Uncharacterized protein n=1 Tax=Roseihalotalea indica TaxID=2867963 RepID=A0AA49JGK9_9BACT|nr:hypothetical protein K4G66_30515 [Tunicatimonas sp. TK19036]
MKRKIRYNFSFHTLLLHSVAVLMVFLFLKDIIQAPLFWLADEEISYELFENIAAEETSDDSESEKKEKKEGTEEFIISGNTVLIPVSETSRFPSFSYHQTFQSRVSEMITPPPQLLSL